jgi:putative ABC transport system permease protein
MRLVLRALIVRPILREKTRTILTVLGIAVGVAVIVAIELANQSALRAFRESVDAIAGRANHQIVPDVAPLDERVLLSLQPLWSRGVRFAPVIDVEGLLEPAQQPIRLLAVDLFSDLHFRDYRYARIETAGPTAGTPQERFLALFRPDAVVLPAPFARERGLSLGSRVTLNINGHRSELVVRGLLEAKGPATAFNGSLAVCDIAAAQHAFGMEGKLSRIDLLVPDEVSLSAVRLPAGVRLERPSRRNERVEKMLQAFRVNLFALAGVALLVGMFLVYNTVLISILRRRKDVGILKTLGVSPAQIFGAFVAEGFLFGVAGSALGILLGYGLARSVLGVVGRTINSLYIRSQPEAVSLTPGVIALGITVGIVLSVLSAIQPALEAAKVRPTAMIRPGLQQRIARPRLLVLLAAISFIAGALVSRIPPVHGIAIAGYVAVLFVVAAFSLLAPAIIQLTSRLLSPLLEGTFGVVGRLAAVSLPASLRRTSIAGAALALATGMMIAVALMVGSFRETVRIWVDQTVRSDLWLRPSQGLNNAQIAVFPNRVADDVATMPFISSVDRIRGKDILYRDTIIALGSADFDVAARLGNLPMITPPSATEALTRAALSDGVLVSESFATKFGSRVGDTIAIPGAGRVFPVTGIYRDYSNDRGVVVMDRGLYTRTFGDDTINTIVVYLKPGTDREVARRALQEKFGPKYGAFVVMNAEVKGQVMKIFDQTFVITYALLGIAIAVAVLGIINTLSALILERTRELALLRVGGLSAGDLRRMLVLESSLLGAASTSAGLVMGYALSWILIHVINKQSFGWTIDFHAPIGLIVVSLAITFFSSTLAGLAPARLARRIDIATALKSE